MAWEICPASSLATCEDTRGLASNFVIACTRQSWIRNVGRPASFLILPNAVLTEVMGSVKIHDPCFDLGRLGKINSSGDCPPSFSHRSISHSIEARADGLSGISR